jgi:hypothetical protein
LQLKIDNYIRSGWSQTARWEKSRIPAVWGDDPGTWSMGLDSVELVMGFEEAFGIVIPDAITSEMITLRDTIDYVASLPAITPVARCLSQQTFYRLRRGLR